MDIHDAARKAIADNCPSGKLPDLRGCGLCYLFYVMGVDNAYMEMRAFNTGDGAVGYLSNKGSWTEERMMLLALLADEGDFI